MLETSARLLALLALLQTRPAWSGRELATRLEVSDRTIRNDIGRLRELGYPVDAERGSAGHYRLGAGASMPPLLLDDEEAVAITVALRAARGIEGVEEASARALAKLDQVLPSRLRGQVAAIATAVEHGPENTTTNEPDAIVDPAALAAIASAIGTPEWLRFEYRGDPVLVEPYRLVSWERRWYLVARGLPEGEWGVYRVDWMSLRSPTRRRFAPRPLRGGDYTSLVLRTVASAGWLVHARILVLASAEEVLARINPAVGVVEAVGPERCVLVTGADSLETLAVYIGMLGLPFRVESPDELRGHFAVLAARYAAAADGGAA